MYLKMANCERFISKIPTCKLVSNNFQFIDISQHFGDNTESPYEDQSKGNKEVLRHQCPL